MFQTYQPSGRFGILTVPLFLAGVFAVVILAWIYQFLIYWIPFIYINFFLTIGFGFAVGMVASFVVTMGHVRSSLIALLLGVALSVCGLGAKYWFQYQTLLGVATSEVMEKEGIPEDRRSDVRRELSKELTFLEHIKIRTAQGWNIGRGGRAGLPLTGVFVYLIWLIEAGIVLGMAGLIAAGAGGAPYSEQLGKWASEEETVMVLPITSEAMVAQIQAATSIEQLLELPIPQTDQSNQFAVYKVNSIAGEEMEDAYLTVELLTVTLNDKGEEEKDEKDLVVHAVLSAANRAKLVENASLLKEAMQDFRAAKNEERLSAQEKPAKKDDDELPFIPLD